MVYRPSGSLSMGFPRQEYCKRLPFPFPEDPPDPGIELTFLALAGGFFTTEPSGKFFEYFPKRGGVRGSTNT